MNVWWDEQNDQRRTAITAALDFPRGRQYLNYAAGDREFAAWLLVADATCRHWVGLSIFDIDDWAWRAAYEAGDKPGTALREALAADDTAAMLLDGE